MNDFVAAVGAFLMLGGLVMYFGSLARTLRGVGPARERQLLARLKIGAFAVVFVGAGLFILTRPANYAVPAALGVFVMAIFTAMLALAIRLPDR